jgi:hypothetical protein
MILGQAKKSCLCVLECGTLLSTLEKTKGVDRSRLMSLTMFCAISLHEISYNLVPSHVTDPVQATFLQTEDQAAVRGGVPGSVKGGDGESLAGVERLLSVS